MSGNRKERLRSDGKYIAKEAAELRMKADTLLNLVRMQDSNTIRKINRRRRQ